jgi:CBS-domain-containing membrane protein
VRSLIAKFRGEGAPLPPRASGRQIALAFAGATLAIAAIAHLHAAAATLLFGSLGASSLLCFGFPDAPFSQPRNIVLGHVLSSALGVLFLQAFGGGPWSLGLAVGAACAAMMALRIPHPPAASNPVIVFLGGQSWGFVLFPTAVGAALLVAVAVGFHALTRPGRWPKHW